MSSGWWAVIVAVLAALVAGWQAWEARRARKEAQKASEAAAEHEKAALDAATRSADAAGRSASAQERIATATEAQLEPKDLWTARHISGERWEVINRTGRSVKAKVMQTRAIRPLNEADAVVKPDSGLLFQWGNRVTARPVEQVAVQWTTGTPGDDGTVSLVTLER